MSRIGFLFLVLGLAILVSLPAGSQSAGVPADQITWKKTVVDTKFRSEGVGLADVNKDGKMDIIAGDVWYEAPDWRMHEIRKPTKRGGGGDASAGHDPANYSNSFCCFIDDFNADGWADVIVIPFPNEQCNWYENPQNKPGHWKAHPVWRSACNETPQFADLFGDGKRYLLMGIQPEGQMCWFSPSKEPERPWEPHPISTEKSPGTERFYHGLGVGDMNGDGRKDVIIPAGWWEQPPDAKTTTKPWTFHKANLGDACADMYAFDADGDGKIDVFSSSAHKRGIWWYQQTSDKTATEFKKHDVFTEFTQTHAMHFVDINGDGKKDLVTGKRWWAHGAKRDEDPGAPAVLYWFEIVTKKGAMPQFVPHKIDDDSGVGTQFVVDDINGDKVPDVVIANKKGVFVLEQVRRK